ncbi:OmpA family protein [Paraburkholderia sp. LEh10]|uniref:OmpA/MotB family protein n=1 Tax=Paraburkholderia sp. LEh10 TaxID=2821353 RepID=UPI001AE16A84|nr:OmpA family protein [Paraburkholderia sp. LEh10]MBP0594059.1 OmpA family protein [Paraburkholderia sp. LEh10]
MDIHHRYRRQPAKTASHLGEEEADGDASSERWLISYADLITTLMVFFLALYVLQLAKTREVEMKALAARVSHDNVGNTNRVVTVAAEREAARKSLLTQLETLKDNKQITVRSENQGVEIGIDARILFNPGDARLLPQSLDVLGDIAMALRKQPDSHVLVEGHTDSIPISNARYASNWELSSARAGAVVRLFVDKGISSRRLAAVGRADNYPLVIGNDAAARAMNRRVTILVQY